MNYHHERSGSAFLRKSKGFENLKGISFKSPYGIFLDRYHQLFPTLPPFPCSSTTASALSAAPRLMLPTLGLHGVTALPSQQCAHLPASPRSRLSSAHRTFAQSSALLTRAQLPTAVQCAMCATLRRAPPRHGVGYMARLHATLDFSTTVVTTPLWIWLANCLENQHNKIICLLILVLHWFCFTIGKVKIL